MEHSENYLKFVKATKNKLLMYVSEESLVDLITACLYSKSSHSDCWHVSIRADSVCKFYGLTGYNKHSISEIVREMNLDYSKTQQRIYRFVREIRYECANYLVMTCEYKGNERRINGYSRGTISLEGRSISDFDQCVPYDECTKFKLIEIKKLSKEAIVGKTEFILTTKRNLERLIKDVSQCIPDYTKSDHTIRLDASEQEFIDMMPMLLLSDNTNSLNDTQNRVYIIKHYYGLGVVQQPLSDMGKHFDKTLERVRQVKDSCLKALASPRAIKEYGKRLFTEMTVTDWMDSHHSNGQDFHYAKFVFTYMLSSSKTKIFSEKYMSKFKLFCTYKKERFRIYEVNKNGDLIIGKCTIDRRAININQIDDISNEPEIKNYLSISDFFEDKFAPIYLQFALKSIGETNETC